MSRLPTSMLFWSAALFSTGCEANQDLFLYHLVDACGDAHSSSPWIDTVDHSERVYDEAGVGHETAEGPVHGVDAREQNPNTDWTGTVVLDLEESYAEHGSQSWGTLTLRSLAPEGDGPILDGVVDYERRYQSEGADIVPDGEDRYRFVPPDWSHKVTRISGDLDFDGRWGGRHTVDLTVTVESIGDETNTWLVGEFDGRPVDRSDSKPL